MPIPYPLWVGSTGILSSHEETAAVPIGLLYLNVQHMTMCIFTEKPCVARHMLRCSGYPANTHFCLLDPSRSSLPSVPPPPLPDPTWQSQLISSNSSSRAPRQYRHSQVSCLFFTRWSGLDPPPPPIQHLKFVTHSIFDNIYNATP